MTLRRTSLALATGLACFGALAALVFSDDFNASPLGLNTAPAGWTVADGTVDVIGNPGFFDLLPGNGRYIDLDGSTGNAGDLSRSFSLTGGVTYTASYHLAGSQRGDTNTVAVSLGTSTQSHTLASSVGFTAFNLSFTPLTSGSYSLLFSHAGGDNIGLLLDNVALRSAEPNGVPTPPSLALALAGLALLGTLRRRAAA